MSTEIGTTGIVSTASLLNTGKAPLTFNTTTGMKTVVENQFKPLDALGRDQQIFVKSGATTIGTITFSTAGTGSFSVTGGATVKNAGFDVTVKLRIA